MALRSGTNVSTANTLDDIHDTLFPCKLSFTSVLLLFIATTFIGYFGTASLDQAGYVSRFSPYSAPVHGRSVHGISVNGTFTTVAKPTLTVTTVPTTTNTVLPTPLVQVNFSTTCVMHLPPEALSFIHHRLLQQTLDPSGIRKKAWLAQAPVSGQDCLDLHRVAKAFCRRMKLTWHPDKAPSACSSDAKTVFMAYDLACEAVSVGAGDGRDCPHLALEMSMELFKAEALPDFKRIKRLCEAALTEHERERERLLEDALWTWACHGGFDHVSA